MIKVKKSFPLNQDQVQKVFTILKDNQRICPACGLESLKGMPGGRDSTCKNCGYKDPCCYD